MKRVYIPLLFFLLLGAVACQSNDNTPRMVADWQPTASASRTPLPTATPYNPIEQTLPEVDPWPTPSELESLPTLAPSPTPAAMFIDEVSGFSMSYPPNWEVLDQNANTITLRDDTFNVLAFILSNYKTDDETFESFVETYSEEFLQGVLELTGEWSIEYLDEGLPFTEDGEAQVAILRTEDGLISVRLAYIEDDNRIYNLIMIGGTTEIENRSATFETMLATAEKGEGSLFGLDRSDTLVFLGGDPLPRAFDPAKTTGSAGGYIGLLYSGLVRLAPTMQIEPDLAETWSVNDDGTVYTFTLRDGLTFADGSPLTAYDVQFSLERAADPETDSPTAQTYLGDILGFQAKLDGEADTVEGIEVIDERTIRITLDGSKPYFLAKLTYPTSYVVDEESINPDDDEWVYSANTSGPFILQDRREDTAYIFARNENFHTPAEVTNLVYLTSRIGSGLSLFESGEIDLIGLGSDDVLTVRVPSHPLHDQWLTTTSLCTTYISMNNEMAPFDDLNVRLAFALAVNKDGYNEQFNEGLDVRGDTILPPSMPGYSQETAQQQAEQTFDVEQAQALLAASSYADGLPPITLTTGGFGDSERLDLNYLIADWEEILGAEITIDFVSDDRSVAQAIRANHGQMVSGGWCADYPDPQNFLEVLFQTESDFNEVEYSNPEIDALLAEAGEELDPARRLELYQQIERMLLEDGAIISLRHGVRDVLISERVEGYILAPIGTSIMRQLSIVEEE